jgi:hypothetical protein
MNRINFEFDGYWSEIALPLYVVPRATGDFDFIVHLQPQDIDSLVENFEEGKRNLPGE